MFAVPKEVVTFDCTVVNGDHFKSSPRPWGAGKPVMEPTRIFSVTEVFKRAPAFLKGFSVRQQASPSGDRGRRAFVSVCSGLRPIVLGGGGLTVLWGRWVGCFQPPEPAGPVRATLCEPAPDLLCVLMWWGELGLVLDCSRHKVWIGSAYMQLHACSQRYWCSAFSYFSQNSADVTQLSPHYSSLCRVCKSKCNAASSPGVKTVCNSVIYRVCGWKCVIALWLRHEWVFVISGVWLTWFPWTRSCLQLLCRGDDGWL